MKKKSQLFAVHATYRADLAAFVPRAHPGVSRPAGHATSYVSDRFREGYEKDEVRGGRARQGRAKGRSAKKSLPPPVLWTRN